ncbi:TRP-like ion channel Pkd2 [Bulinus truncatus]|nr:TRP-like ion channel Pkd2 [Bulinus truncatus]
MITVERENLDLGFLNYIAIKDLQTDVKQVFIANRWLALEEDDGQIDRIIPLAGREQMSDFSYQFGERTKPRNINPGHIGSSFGGSRPSTAKLSQVHPQVDQSRSTISLATTASYPDGRSDCEQLVHNSDQAILLSLIIKNPGEDDDEDEEEEHVYPVNTEDEYLHNKQDVITHNNRGPDNFRYKNNMVKTFITNQNLNKTLVKFNDVQSASDFWEWLNNGFITGILANAYYNDYPPLKLRSYINDKASRIIGHAVLRQLRIKADLCSVPGIMSSAIKECNIAYNIADQEEGNFNTSWTPINKSDTTFVPKSEYSYSSAESLNGYPYWGNMALYSGGGYVAHLNGTKKDIENTLQQLQQESWIDKYTRAIFIEFTVYNPQVNLFSVNMLLAEFNLNNAILPSFRFEPAMLLPYMTNAMIFQIVCEVIFVLYIIGFIVKELLQVIKFNRRISMLSDTLKHSGKQLFHFSIIFWIIFWLCPAVFHNAQFEMINTQHLFSHQSH